MDKDTMLVEYKIQPFLANCRFSKFFHNSASKECQRLPVQLINQKRSTDNIAKRKDVDSRQF